MFSDIIYGFVFSDILSRVDKVFDIFFEFVFGKRGYVFGNGS